MRWTIVIPVKTLPAAKSRLRRATPDDAGHRRLVEAIRADTVAAAERSPEVARVLLVVDDPAAGLPGVEALVQTAPGLNGALRDAAAHAGARWPADGVAALLGDLPALRAEHLTQALRRAAGHPSAFVPDADGTGTTLLTARPGETLAPAFGPGSAARHATVAHRLPAPDALRADVDEPADLVRAARLGVGTHTAAAHVGSPAQEMMCR